MTGEFKDMAYTALANQATELDRDLHEALNDLRAMASDFSEDSQQRWMMALRSVSALRDELWLIQQQIGKLDQE